ncbi:nucleotidyltransferase family protein [Paenibacillus tarimensis]|uniref:nucleotidyltransferase family protein n=1 Tax=Paenibacillus tarimensis TaxID=416012 RepID=UPI001F492911|nr:nucleotidyltransferase family protein [Paenibacillus tarimensis]MCF2942854.1 nucleotidyltransferase family protein [Paenibacillus tarimensis]
MNIRNEQELIALIQKDEWMVETLEAAASLRLPDWWICAGFVRSKIWDVQLGIPGRTPLPDVDVIYFDPSDLDEAVEKQLEARLRSIKLDVPWSVKNQARMHLLNAMPPYLSSEDAMSKFPETATALGVSLAREGRIILAAPHGLQDALSLTIRPTPLFRDSHKLAALYERRIAAKKWHETWKGLTIIHTNERQIRH